MYLNYIWQPERQPAQFVLQPHSVVETTNLKYLYKIQFQGMILPLGLHQCRSQRT